MEIKRGDVAKLIDFIRRKIAENKELSFIISIDDEFDDTELIYGISNEYLSSLIETITGHKVEVIGEVEELFKCPCCGYNTLTEIFNQEEGTGYDICPLCGWEDDGTTDINEYRAINNGSIADYRQKLSSKGINKWIKID